MTDTIKRALLSVSDKTGIVEFAKFLASKNIELLSTGGTAKALRDAGLKVKEVAEHTEFPEMLEGRVKTLHPKIHGGLLGRRNVKEHSDAMTKHGITPIDLVVINLYPFEATVAKGASYDDCVENIDIGGPAMVRSAAKNHEHVTVVVDPADYAQVQKEIEASNATSFETRKKLAAKAFARTSAYDSAINQWFAKELQAFPPYMGPGVLKQELRYGENPHQIAAFYTYPYAPKGISTASQVQGKELSYNNINDTDAAFELVREFNEPAIAIIKHANPCGVAVGKDITEAFAKALACDPVSAYGGIIATNRTLDAKTVEAIGSLFLEVIIAPDASPEAKALLEKKKNLRLLLTGGMPQAGVRSFMCKQVSGGFLFQENDMMRVTREQLKVVSKRAPTEQEFKDLLFAFTVAKHVKSNAIVLAKNESTVGIGAGQMSRVDSVRIACWKAEEAKLATKGCAMASDAFFPFDDNVHNAAKAGITSLIHPGGSIRDEEVIKAADQYDMAMVMTGVRHFRH